MKPAPFGFDAKILAGGQSLIPTMNFRLAQPQVLIDINGIDDLAGIEATDEGVRIGAMTRQREMEQHPAIRSHTPLLHEAIRFVAHPQIRNRGTVGGSVAHADPAGELPAVLMAAEARIHLEGPAGARTVAAADFFRGLFATDMAQDELLTAISVPAEGEETGSAFVEVARRHGDYALVGVAARVRLRSNECVDAKVALLNVADRPVLAKGAQAILVGEEPNDRAVESAAAEAAREIDPPGDIHASAEYRRHLTSVLTRRALRTAFNRAQGR